MLTKRREFVYYLLLLAPLIITAPPLLVGDRLYLSTYTDDLYYYLKIANNILDGKGSTFNGLVDTNGYQPLWQLLIIVLEGISRVTNINLFALLVMVLSGFAAWSLRELYLMTGINHSPLLVATGHILYLNIALTGMEVAALVPMLLYLFRHFRTSKNGRDWLLSGFYASIVVLLRLDSAVFIAIFLLLSRLFGLLPFPDLLRFLLGGLLLPSYIVFNVVTFGAIMPVSGSAKGVAGWNFVIHGWTFRSIFNYGLVTSVMNGLMIVVWVYLSVMMCTKKLHISRHESVWLLSCCVFVPAFYVITAIRSDWPIWRWYFYPLVLVSLCALPLLGRLLESLWLFFRENGFVLARKFLEFPLALVVSIAFVFMSTSHLLNKNTRHKDAEVIRDFVTTHPGVYAMGDRAGLPAYLVDEPFVQLEGLVMDREYLNRLTTAKSIEKLLTDYGVEFYIGSPRGQVDATCYKMKEPVYSQGYSRYVESNLCWPVVKVIHRSGGGRFLIFRNPHGIADHDA